MAHSGKTMTFATDLVPQEDNIYSLGRDNLKWIIRGSLPLSDITDADDLKAIEALSDTSGLLKKTAANTWALDTNNYATKTEVNGLLAAANAMTFKGVINATNALPNSHNAGDTYRVGTAGTYPIVDSNGRYCEVGTLIICITDGTAANAAHWTSVETNEDGAVIGPASSTDNAIARFDGVTGRIIQNSGITINDNGNLVIAHATSATMTTASTNPQIIFSENGSQPVHLIYSDYDNYRAPAGLKVVGGTSATPAWFEVEGNIYAAAFKGNADTATSAGKWTTARNISISDSSGTNTGTAVSVDGSAAATLKLPATIKATVIGDGSQLTSLKTQNLVRPAGLNGVNDVTYQALINDVRANRLAFLPADQIIIEKTTDGGITWEDAGIPDGTKTALFSETRPGVYIPKINNEINTNCGLRITITAMKYDVPAGTPETQKYNYWNSSYVKSTERYNQIKLMYFWVSTANNALKITVQKATGANPNSWTNVFLNNNYGMTGWSGNDIITFGQGVFGGGTTQTGNTWNWRITLMTCGPNGSDTLTQSSLTSTMMVSEIRGYGDTYWTAGNKYAASDHLYSWDSNKNATFPSNITASKFIGALQGAATSADKWTTARTFTIGSTGKSVDGSGNVSWSLAEIGAAAASHSHSYLANTNTGAADRPIYITGNAASPTTYRMAGTNVTATTALAITNDLDTGIWYVSGTNSTDLYSQGDGVAYVEKYNNSWIHEIYGDYRTGQIAVRGKNNGTWQDWRKVLDETNGATILGLDVGSNNAATLTWGTTYTIAKINGVDIKFTTMVKPSYAFTDLTAHPTTLNDYGITDAKIASGVITLGSNTITPVTSVNGHSGSSVSVTASDLGLASALKYVGTKSSLPTATDSTTYSTYNNGDVITVSAKEYAYVKGSNAAGSSWVELGDEGSYKLKQTAFTNGTGTADGTNTSTSFIYSFSQNENGVISDIKTRQLPTLTNVSYTAATDNNEYPILLKNSTGSDTTTAGVKFANTTNKMTTINPSTGMITAPSLTIASNAAIAHLAFARAGWNYITMPNNDSSVISIGYGTPADNTTQRLVIFKTGTVRPGANGSQNLGDDTHKWNNVYGINFYGSTFSGTANKANYLRCFGLEANDDLNLIDSHADEGIFQNCWVGGGEAGSIQNRPDSYGVASFGMLAFKIATNWTGQILLSTNSAPGLYWRANNNSSSPAYGAWARVWDSSNHRVFYGTCTEAAGTAAKAVGCANYDGMKVGDIITVKFDNTNTAASPTLNVNGKGSKSVKMAYSGGTADLSSYTQLAGIRTFIYDGTNWILQEGECVKQGVTDTTSDIWRPVMLGAYNSTDVRQAPEQRYAMIHAARNVKYHQTTGTLRAPILKTPKLSIEYSFEDKAHIQWNDTDSSIDFIFD